ncbi:MAG: FG-GAP repeat protein [Planctomycetota bacterium]
MNPSRTRLNRWVLCRSLAAACALFGALAGAVPAPAQCNPNELQKILASDGAMSDYFGASVAISGDTAVVGSYQDDHAGGADAGSAYVFVRCGGIWTQQAKLTASDAAADDRFGHSVAVLGDTILIGAYQDDTASGSNAGSAYVFIRTGGVWTQQAKLTASDAAAQDFFGFPVALSGDTALIGAYLDDDGGTSSGSAYVFVRTGVAWTQQAKLTASDAAEGDAFGVSVSLSDDTAVVGAYGDDDAGSASGSAYVFTRTGVVWTQQAKLTASDPEGNASFGYAAAVSGDTTVIGAYQHNKGPGEPDAGSAYVFVRSGGIWTQQAQLIASDAAGYDQFGFSAALSGNIAVIGAHTDDHVAGIDAGSAYVFTRAGDVWSQQAKLTASDAAANDYFGVSVSLSNEMAVIGAYGNDDAGGASGSAYLIDLDCGGDSDGDGVLDIYDDCPNTAANLAVDCYGRPLRDCSGDCLVNGLDVQCIVDEMLNQ